MLIWTDIENQPQVQHLLPVIEACRHLGAQTVISARDYGGTLTLPEDRGETFQGVGASYAPAGGSGLVSPAYLVSAEVPVPT